MTNIAIGVIIFIAICLTVLNYRLQKRTERLEVMFQSSVKVISILKQIGDMAEYKIDDLPKVNKLIGDIEKIKLELDNIIY
jgi:hypothetical protein